MSNRIPFGPGHPDYDNQLSLFADTEERESSSDLKRPQSCPACCEDSSKASEAFCSLCGGKGVILVKLRKVPGFWQCQQTGTLVKADTEKAANRKLGKDRQVVPAYVEHGGYC